MSSPRNNLLKLATAIALAVTFAPAALSAQPSPSPPPADPLNSAYAVGAHISYSQREGYRRYEGASKYQRIDDTDPFIFGGAIGKRFALSVPWLRLQAMAEGSYGTVKDGDFYVGLTTGEDVLASLFSNYTTGGVVAEAHLLMPVGDNTYYISAGLGGHVIYSNSSLQTAHGGKEIRGWEDDGAWMLSPSVNIGFGADRIVHGRRASSISYNFRIWQSWGGKMVDEIFPMGVDYREFLFTHTIQFHVVLPSAGAHFRQ